MSNQLYLLRDIARQNLENALADFKEADNKHDRHAARKTAKKELNILLSHMESLAVMEAAVRNG